MTYFEDARYVSLFDSIDAVRRHREAFLDELASGSLSVADVFARAESDAVLASMKVLPAIEAIPDNKKVSTRRAFDELGISEAALIEHVSLEAISELPAAIDRHGL